MIGSCTGVNVSLHPQEVGWKRGLRIPIVSHSRVQLRLATAQNARLRDKNLTAKTRLDWSQDSDGINLERMTPNLIAYGALLAWPIVAAVLFATRPFREATIWTILGGYLLLPVGTIIKFEMIPAFDKNSVPNLVALVGCIVVAGRVPRLIRRFGLPDILILMLLVSPFITSALNTDDIRVGDIILPGVGYYDGGSALLSQFIFFIPFLLARHFLRSAEDTVLLLRVLVIAGLAYSLPMLFEVRMSPQLHTWIYGYFPHSFLQQYRDGGFRPVVFLGHGLVVAFFCMTTVLAATALWRTNTRIAKIPPAGVAAYLGVVLVFCRSLGALTYGVVLAPLVRWATPRTQFRVAVVLAAIALSYPMLRTMDLVPTRFLLETASSVSADRAQSLGVRFENEDILLAHAHERKWFGWGRFGRNRVYDEESGRDVSITDGRWIIMLGTFGVFGFLAEFGLLALAVFRAASALRFAEEPADRVYLAALGVIVAINMIELLPNSTFSPWTWLLAGALLGRAEALRSGARQRIVQWNVSRGAVAN